MNRFYNGFDSYKKAIRGIVDRNVDEYILKDIIINFHHSVEVLFKHILYERDKCLIYQDMDKWINYNFDKKVGLKGEKKEIFDIEYTISFDDVVRRVIVLCNVSLDEYGYDGFRNLNKFRNALTHDEIELNRDSIEQVVVSLLPTVNDILRNNLKNEEKRQFEEFIDSDYFIETFNSLLSENIKWRIITVLNLLQMYSQSSLDEISNVQITNLEKTLSALGKYVEHEEFFLKIDDEYYISIISYLKQSICDMLISCPTSELKKIDTLKKNKIVNQVLEEYLEYASQYIYSFLQERSERIEPAFFMDDERVAGKFDGMLLVNQNDIFVLLGCMKRITDVYGSILGKRRDDILKGLYLGDDKEQLLSDFYNGLFKWFKTNGWYNSENIDNLDEHSKEAIGMDEKYMVVNDGLCFEIEDRFFQSQIDKRLIGEYCKLGTIDKVNDILVQNIETIIKKDDVYTLIFVASLDVETSDYDSTGNVDGYVTIEGKIKSDDVFEIDSIEYLGYTIGFHNFKFD